MAEHNDFGKKAEDLAVDFLSKKGYKIIARNYRHLKSEIDIIAETDNEIIIIEVKARGTDLFLEPQEAVNKKKIRLIVAAADQFIQDKNTNKNVRFDIVTIVQHPNSSPKIVHIENAFEVIDAN